MKKITMDRHILGNTWHKDGTMDFYRVSRWIQVRTAYAPNKRNTLYDYFEDENGRTPADDSFNRESASVFYFIYNGKKYALNQFTRCGCMFSPVMYSYEDEDGKTCYLSGYEAENYWTPLFIEIADGGEYVRCYEEVTR